MDQVKTVLQVGDPLPNATLYESTGYGNVCPLAPAPVKILDAVGSKKTIVFGIPAAFSTTCSEQHIPGFQKLADEFRQHGVESIICVAVNDGWVMGEYRKSLKADKIRFLGDGDAEVRVDWNVLDRF